MHDQMASNLTHYPEERGNMSIDGKEIIGDRSDYRPDSIEMEKFICAIHGEDDLFEVRAFSGRHIFAGWFRASPGVGVVVAEKLKGLGTIEGAFVTVHRIKPDAIDPRRIGIMPRQTKKSGGTTRDEDVSERLYLVVDVDPVRAAGCEKLGATDAERAAALEVAIKVREDLEGFLGAPLFVDSGNGAHLYFHLPRPEPGGPIVNDDDDPITLHLRLLARRYDTAGARIDTTVRNASRVMRLPGTWARKGDATPDRPHRMAKLLGGVPHGWQPG